VYKHATRGEPVQIKIFGRVENLHSVFIVTSTNDVWTKHVINKVIHLPTSLGSKKKIAARKAHVQACLLRTLECLVTAKAKVPTEVFFSEQCQELNLLGVMSCVLRHLRALKEGELRPLSQYLIPMTIETLEALCPSFSKWAQNVMPPELYELRLRERISSVDRKLRPAAHLAPAAASERVLMGTSMLEASENEEEAEEPGEGHRKNKNWSIFDKSKKTCDRTATSTQLSHEEADWPPQPDFNVSPIREEKSEQNDDSLERIISEAFENSGETDCIDDNDDYAWLLPSAQFEQDENDWATSQARGTNQITSRCQENT